MENRSLIDNINNLHRLLGDNSQLKETHNDSYTLDSELDKEHRQYIYFGAPGTGKSFQLNKDSSMFLKDNVERITFHSNTTYGSFVGVFKPFPVIEETNDGSVNTSITYRYVPGILMRQLTRALLDPENAYLLIIEEINRANTAATFGDMFQLLDRDENNRSEYPIAISEDIQYYFDNIVYKDDKNKDSVSVMESQIQNGLIFPKNFFIWATMNSADQGVMPMDTAFKRRWEQKYFGINQNYDESTFENYKKINIKYDNKSVKISWNNLRVFLNDILISELKVPEDKLMGPYFISKHILSSSDELLTESFKNKVLMYLFDDAAKQNRSKLFNLPNKIMLYSEVLKEFEEKGITVFQNFKELVDKLEPIE